MNIMKILKTWYQSHFRNLTVARGFNNTCSFKRLVEPANTYAIDWDRRYCEKSFEHYVLKSLGLVKISLDDIKRIEIITRKQSESDT